MITNGNTQGLEHPQARKEVAVRAAHSSYRLRWLDYSRCFTVAIVVYAHLRQSMLASGLLDADQVESLLQYGRIVTICTMPMFFFMSGNFIRSGARHPLPVFVDDKLRTIAWPYFLWSAVYFLGAWALGVQSSHWDDLDRIWTIVYFPTNSHMWFFYALFCAGILYALATHARVSPAWIFAGSLAFYATRFLDFELISQPLLLSLRENLPYYTLGALVNHGGPLIRFSESPTRRLFALAAVAYCVSAYTVLHGWPHRSGLTLVPIAASALGLMSVAILLERSGRATWLAFIGRHSMEIYVAHVFGYQIVSLALRVLPGAEPPLLYFLLGMTGGIGGPLLLVLFTRRLGIKYLFSLRGLHFPATRLSSSRTAAALKDSRD